MGGIHVDISRRPGEAVSYAMRAKGLEAFSGAEGERCMKDTVHAGVHRSVHLFGEEKTNGALRLRFTRPLILDKGKTPEWAGATPLFATWSWRKNRGVAPAHTFSEKGISGRKGIGMLLAIQKSYELLAKYGCFAREICDKCGIVLGAVRFTRHGESKVYCSRKCRGETHRSATHRR